jgi:hypothetical protein
MDQRSTFCPPLEYITNKPGLQDCSRSPVVWIAQARSSIGVHQHHQLAQLSLGRIRFFPEFRAELFVGIQV